MRVILIKWFFVHERYFCVDEERSDDRVETEEECERRDPLLVSQTSHFTSPS